MDRLESLGNSISQITLYDIKSMYNQVRKECGSITPFLTTTQAKNVVFNVSEMEAKVQEATNDEPW
jgi:epsin